MSCSQIVLLSSLLRQQLLLIVYFLPLRRHSFSPSRFRLLSLSRHAATLALIVDAGCDGGGCYLSGSRVDVGRDHVRVRGWGVGAEGGKASKCILLLSLTHREREQESGRVEDANE